jgi:hypothetical protein
MTNEQKPSRTAHVPGILMGTAALIAALSTLYVNLRNEPAPVAAEVAPAPPVPATPDPASAAPAAARVVRVRLDRVQVDDDGSVGSTDWTFQASIDGEPRFSVAMPSLSDKPGENLARPADGQESSVDVELAGAKSVALTVNGWKKGLLGGARGEVSGSAWLASGVTKATVTVASDKPKGPRFVLYFTVAPVD